MVVEEYPAGEAAADEVAPSREPALIVLSAKTVPVLRERAKQLLDVLDSGEIGDGQLADLAYTLQMGRQGMAARLAVVVDSVAALRARLQSWLEGDTRGIFAGELSAEATA